MKASLILFVLALILGFMIHGAYSTIKSTQTTRIDAPSQCFSTAESSAYFSKSSSQTFSYSQRQLTIIDPYDRALYWEQAAGTGSMRPGIGTGTVLITVKPLIGELKVGDIVIAEAKPGYAQGVVHRIFSIEQSSGKTFYTLKGDNNPVPDTVKWEHSEIRSKVVGVLY